MLISLCWCHFVYVTLLMSLCWCTSVDEPLLMLLCWFHSVTNSQANKYSLLKKINHCLTTEKYILLKTMVTSTQTYFREKDPSWLELEKRPRLTTYLVLSYIKHFWPQKGTTQIFTPDMTSKQCFIKSLPYRFLCAERNKENVMN